jgi:tripartite-type tricarboxylate transporter receptor subunit TctC
LRGLATTGSEPSPLLPDLPTMATSLPGFRVLFWTALIAPAGTPPDIQKRLNDAVKAALESPSMKSGLEKAGEVSSYMSLADVKTFFTSEKNMWEKVVRESKLELE